MKLKLSLLLNFVISHNIIQHIVFNLRYFIEFAYNGKEFYGFQVQPDVVSVQETLDKALSLLFKESIQIIGAGRTDSGVHAKQMYAQDRKSVV